MVNRVNTRNTISEDNLPSGGIFGSFSDNAGGLMGSLGQWFSMLAQGAMKLFSDLFGGRLGSVFGSGGNNDTEARRRSLNDFERYAPLDARPGTYDFAFSRVLEAEGGFADHPNDPGGKTIYGITERSHPRDYRAVMALYNSGRETEAIQYAYEFYERNYYTPTLTAFEEAGIEANWQNTLIAFDFAVNSGVGRVSTLLEETGGDPNEMLAWRREFYGNLIEGNSRLAVFRNGWNNRLIRLEEDINVEYSNEELGLEPGSTFNAGDVLVRDADGELIHPDRLNVLLENPEYAVRYLEKYLPTLDETIAGKESEATQEVALVQKALTTLSEGDQSLNPGVIDGVIGTRADTNTRKAIAAYIESQREKSNAFIQGNIIDDPNPETSETSVDRARVAFYAASSRTGTYQERFTLERLGLLAQDEQTPDSAIVVDGIITPEEETELNTLSASFTRSRSNTASLTDESVETEAPTDIIAGAAAEITGSTPPVIEERALEPADDGPMDIRPRGMRE